MANKSLFQTLAGKFARPATAVNEAGGVAYELSPRQALAQYAATGCLNATFYADSQDQLQKVLELVCKPDITSEFIAQTAIFARQRGYMKDMPALLCAVLASFDRQLLERVFPRVIDNGKMLRNFVQIMRSGATGRKSFGTAPRRMIREWLENRSDDAVFTASVGNAPSLADVIKMVHPRPATPSRTALYGYLLGRPHDADALPENVRRYEAFKAGNRAEVPDVSFQLLTALDLGRDEWVAIARRASWQMTRMNLNTFARHGVFEVKGMAELIANRLRDENAVRQARVFPYQLMTAYTMTGENVPAIVREALQDAMDIALSNVPRIEGKVYVFPDISGSMYSSVTGYRKGATSQVRCLDVAALVAAAIVRRNPTAEVIAFEEKAVPLRLNPRDSVMTNAAILAKLPAGGTNCSAPLAYLNQKKAQGDMVIYVSDNESWLDSPHYGSYGSGSRTKTMEEWARFQHRNPRARMVCLDIQPYATTQAHERADILNIGGFSDQVFEVIAEFGRGTLNANHWVGVIENIKI